MLKEWFKKQIETKENQRAQIKTQAAESKTLEEARGYSEQLKNLENEIAELRSQLNLEENKQDQSGSDEPKEFEQRNNIPNGIMKTLGVFGGNNDFPNEEARNKEIFEQKEKRGFDLKEGRAVSVSNSNIVLPKYASSTINQGFNAISSLIDNVDVMVLSGGESFMQPYEIATPEGNYTGEGETAKDTDISFGYAEIARSKITSYSEITKEITKLTAADYETSVVNGMTRSLRKKLTKEILIGDGATGHLTGIFSENAKAINSANDIVIGAIDTSTLKKIVFAYGSDEEVDDQAVLMLNKNDLMAFSQLKTSTGSDYHKIVTNGNSGTIDGIPFIINSAGCSAISNSKTASGAYCMAYGSLQNYKLVVFSNINVERSTDYKFRDGMIAHRGEVFAGGNVVVSNGFVRVKKAPTV